METSNTDPALATQTSNSNSPPALLGQFIKAANTLSTRSDRWWVSFLLLVGMTFTAVQFYWSRQDQQEQVKILTTVIQDNTATNRELILLMNNVKQISEETKQILKDVQRAPRN